MLLSLDISIASTGYCIFNNGELIGFGCIRTNNTKNIFDRLTYIENEVQEIIKDFSISEVAIEAPSYGSRGAMSYSLFSVHFSIVRIVYNLKLPYRLLNIASIKKFATDSGRATKSDMLNALPDDVRRLFMDNGFLKSKGLYDLVDSYFIGKKYIKER